MSRENKFEEATIWSPYHSMHNLTIDEITNIYENEHIEYLRIKQYMYCPECQKALLNYCHGTVRVPYLQSNNISDHDNKCSFLLNAVSQTKLKKLYNDNTPETLETIKNRLTHLIDFICIGLPTAKNPLVMKDSITITDINEPSKTTKQVTRKSLPRKILNNHISDKDLACIKFFYGKVHIKYKPYYASGKINRAFLYLYMYDNTKDNNKGNYICSLNLSQNVIKHLPTHYFQDRKVAYIAFFSELNKSEQNAKFVNSTIKHSEFLRISDVP